MEKMTYNNRVEMIAEEIALSFYTELPDEINVKEIYRCIDGAMISVAHMAAAAELLYWHMHNTCDGTEAYIPEYMKATLNEILIEYGLIPNNHD